MSLAVRWLISCKDCSLTFEASVWGSVNTDSPELAQAFLTGTLNVVTCPRCGTSIFVPAPVLYNDMERGLWVQIDDFPDADFLSRKSDAGIDGVHYRRHLRRDIQLIKVDNFELARHALQRLDDKEAFDRIRGSHPEWPASVVFAEVFLYHYKQALSSAPLDAPNRT